MKCDEAKPACRRCTSTGRKCDGYVEDILGSNSQASRGLILQRLSAAVPGTAEEKRCFSYYLHNSAPELSGYYDSSLWEKLLLQAAIEEPALRHALIGISSLHEAFANKQPDNSLDNEKERFAVGQYTKAIGCLVQSLATGDQKPLTALMACILFVCFESLRGQFTSAIVRFELPVRSSVLTFCQVHLRSGLKILRDFRTQSADDEYITAKSLEPAFTRLSIQAILYIDQAPVSDRQALASEMTDIVERDTIGAFTTLEEARDSLNQTVKGLFRVLYTFEPDKPYSAYAETFPSHAKYRKQLSDWTRSFERYMQTNSARLSNKGIRGAAMLKVQHITSSIMANANPPDADDPRPVSQIVSEGERYVPYNKDFENIIELSRSLIAALEEDSRNGKAPLNFTADLGIIAPLYYCCVRCHDRKLRLIAVELLGRCPRKEGMWDSAALVHLIRGYWERETLHEALQANDGGEPVPLSKLLDLILQDGMKWEFKWKEAASRTQPVVPLYESAELAGDWTRESLQDKETNN